MAETRRTNVKSSSKIPGLLREFLDARFEAAQVISRQIKWATVITRAVNEAPNAMMAVSMSVELLDYVGNTKAGRARLERLTPLAETRLRALVDGETKPRSHKERTILKRWVWLALQAAVLEYRAMVLNRAMYLCQLCEAAIDKLRIAPGYSCHGTRSRIHYTTGLIHRESFNYPEAKRSFLLSIELAWESLREKRGASARVFRQSRWTDVTSARAAGLGLAMVYHMDGQPHLALPLLLLSKTLLARAGETLFGTYVDLVYLDARRSSSGADALKVDDAIEGLERCYGVFTKRRHSLYAARAAYSLSLAYSQRARPDESQPLTAAGREDLALAEQRTRDLNAFAPSDGAADQRPALYALLCMSRIERKRDNLDRAVQFATDGIARGGRAHNDIHVGLLIARAEALLRMNNTSGAKDDLTEALKRSQHSLRSRAVCLLRLTELEVRLGHRDVAAGHFERWQQISPHLSNVHLAQLQRTAQAALDLAPSDFTIGMAADEIDRKAIQDRLRGWFATWALKNGGSDVAAAARLGISREALRKWKKLAPAPTATDAPATLAPSPALPAPPAPAAPGLAAHASRVRRAGSHP
jgi:hypothetical protein